MAEPWLMLKSSPRIRCSFQAIVLDFAVTVNQKSSHPADITRNSLSSYFLGLKLLEGSNSNKSLLRGVRLP